MALDNLRCPQFVDFTNVATFSIDDGADIYFEKGVVGELGLGFNDQNTDNDGIDDLISALNDATIHHNKAQNPHDKKDSGISECLNTSPNGNKENNNPKPTTTTNKKAPKTTTTTTTTTTNQYHYRKRTTSASSTTSNGSVNNTTSNKSTTSKYNTKHNSSTQQQQNIVKKTIAKVTAAFKSTSSKQQTNDIKLKTKQTTANSHNRKKTNETHGPLKVEHNAVMITVATQQHHQTSASTNNNNDPQQMVSLEIVQTSTSTRRCSSVPRTLKEKQAVTHTNTKTLGEKIQNFFSRDSNKSSKTNKHEPRHRSRSNNKQSINECDEHDGHKAKGERCSRVQNVVQATTAAPVVVKQQTKALNSSQVNRNNTLTEPKSPNFSKPRQRSCDRKDMLPYQGVKFIPKVAHKYTAIEPFSSLEERNKQAAARKEEKMKKLLQENEMNKYNNSNISGYKPTTTSNRLNSSLNKNNKENTDTTTTAEHIKHQNYTINDSLLNQHKSAANLSTISNGSTCNTSKCKQQASMLLHTEARAQKRQQYDQYLKDKERMAELIKKNLEMQKMMQDKNEIQKLRAQLLFKSKPYNKNCKPMEVRPSEKPLTEPKSPKFISTTSNSKLNGSNGSATGLIRSLSQEDLSTRIKTSDN